MSNAPQDDLTAERAAAYVDKYEAWIKTQPAYMQMLTLSQRDKLAELFRQTRQEALREAARVVKAYIKARDDSRYMSESEDCERWKASYHVYADAADALDRLASEGGPRKDHP